MPDFNFNSGGFPIATVIQAAQRKAELQNQFNNQQTELLNQSIGKAGDILSGIVGRKRAIAQALASSQIFGQTPEGQQLMGNAPVADAVAAPGPVTQNQTAMGGANQTPVSNASPVTPQVLQTAFMGEKPADLLKNITEQSNLRRLYQSMGLHNQLAQGQLALGQQRNATTADLGAQRIGIDQSRVAQSNTSSLRSQNDALSARQTALIAKFPKRAEGFFNSVLPETLQDPQEQQAAIEYKQNQAIIDQNNQKLGNTPQVNHDELPDPSQYSGKKIRDNQSGQLFQSDGISWKPQ